jgi:hypothetical protein
MPVISPASTRPIRGDRAQAGKTIDIEGNNLEGVIVPSTSRETAPSERIRRR